MATCAGDGEGSAQVFHALGAGEGGLVAGGAGPLQGFDDGQADVTGEHSGDFLSLVEMAVLEAPAMKRDGDQRPVTGERRSESEIAE